MKIYIVLLITLINSKRRGKDNNCKNYCRVCDTENTDCLDCEEQSNYFLSDGKCEFNFSNYHYNYADVKKGCIEYDGVGECDVCKGEQYPELKIKKNQSYYNCKKVKKSDSI